MPLKRCVTSRAPASAAARASSYDAVVWPSDTTMPRAASARVAAKSGSASGASVTIRISPGKRSHSARSHVELDRAEELDGMRTRRPAEERAFEVDAERCRRAALRVAEAVEHAGS